MSGATKKENQSPAPKQASGKDDKLGGIFAGLFGILLGLSLLKFGNVVILERMVTWPTDIYQWLLTPWPVVIGWWLFLPVTLAGLAVARRKPGLPMMLIALPALWFSWELTAATQTMAMGLTKPTVIHFFFCVLCFYLGLFALSGVRRIGSFWSGLLPGFFLMLTSGLEQHFGGLAESRKYFMYMYSKGADIDPLFLKKINSDRIFGTLFYPNTLAECILLLLPVTLTVLWSLREKFTAGARQFLVAIAAVTAMACFYWSGSKGGWLLAMVLIVLTAMFVPMKRQFKVAVVVGVLALGLAGFTAKYLGFFQKGATSVVARGDYWEAALKTIAAKPVFGTGPGTFGRAYERVKRPDSEMALLTHDDYLEQASDSGVIGGLLYFAFTAWLLFYTLRKGRLKNDWIRLAVWLGLLGWAMHNCLEFGLYIPALSWTAFAFMGWLLGECSTDRI